MEAGGKQKQHPPKGNILRHMHTDLNLRTVLLSCALQPEAEGAQWPSRFAPSNLKIKVKPSNFIFCCKCQKLLHSFPLPKSALKPFLHFHLYMDLLYSQDLGKISLGLTKGYIMPLKKRISEKKFRGKESRDIQTVFSHFAHF